MKGDCDLKAPPVQIPRTGRAGLLCWGKSMKGPLLEHLYEVYCALQLPVATSRLYWAGESVSVCVCV